MAQARGLAILIGNCYEKQPHGLSKLDGPSKDIENATRVFCGLGGEIRVVKNESAEEIKRVIRYEASRESYPESYEWIVVVFTGHGKELGVYGNDGELIYLERDVIDPFQPKNARLIAKIPKLFFIDACRGSETTQPILVPRGPDSEDSVRLSRGGHGIDALKFPSEGNYLIAFSTFPRTKSFESREGGVWISKLLKTLEIEVDTSVYDILHLVSNDIHKEYQKVGMEVQQPVIESTLLCGVFKFAKCEQTEQQSELLVNDNT